MSGSFGQSPIGSPLWGDQLWATVPGIYREKDLENGGYLKQFIEAVAETFWSAHEYASRLPILRDAMRCEGGFSPRTITVSSVEIVTAEDSETGAAYVILNTEDDLLEVSPGWIVSGARSSHIRSVSAIGGYFTVAGTEDPTSSGVVTIKPPSMLAWLAKDFGTEVDEHEPETYQRNLVYRTSYAQALRGTKDGIIVRSKMSGYSATVRRLFRISSWYYNSLPTGNRFEIPGGSGKYYTDIEPRFLLFDEVRADVAVVDDLPPSSYSESIAVSSVSGTAPTWVLSLVDNPVGIVSVENATWYLQTGDETYYIDSVDLVGKTLTVTSATTTPTVGVYTLRYDARNAAIMSWRASHIVRIELEIIDDSLLNDPVFLEESLTRLIAKLKRVTPAHVEFAQIVFTLRAATVIRVTKSISGYMRLYGKFDEIPADTHPVDQYEETPL